MQYINNTNRPLTAYFCMEFGLHSDFKIYSGGLGILAGDILKAAKDSGYPMVGVGILWRQGYNKQIIDSKNRVVDCFPEYTYDFLEDTGKTVDVLCRGRNIKLKIWKCECFGNVPLYLLDANLSENADRLITGQLYGWFSEERIAQEIILSIGGIRALRVLDIFPDVYHFNDSHPVLAGIELIREYMSEGLSFHDAWQKARQRIVFTTHTPVEAGNEQHEHRLLRYMDAYNGLTYEQMCQIGGDPFNMTVAGLRLSKKANAVSKLHGITANRMWAHVKDRAEIIAITNGVHNGTWQEKKLLEVKNDDSRLWDEHMRLKQAMIDQINKRNGVKLDKDKLIIGFARRAAPYKRSDLIFRKKELIEPLLRDATVQIVFSGKAHPNDLTGKAIVRNLYDMSQKYPNSVVFVQDYDMYVGAMLTRGCDVWLNNPVRPMEASGTSGMKAAMNGVLNLSVLDGWWPEGCIHGINGWQIGHGYEGPEADRVDAESLIYTLINEVIPAFYNDRDRWISMMRESINMATEKFSASRMVSEYYNLLY